MISNKPVTF